MAVEPPSGNASVVSVRDMLLDHDRRLDAIDLWRAELRGAMQLVRLTFGMSLLSVIVMGITLYLQLQRP